MPDTFAALAEPRRREILNVLRDGEACVGDLVVHLGISQPAVSKHLRVLRDAGLVAVRAERQQRMYRIEPAPLRDLDEWLAPYRQHWATTLGRLEQHLDAGRTSTSTTITDQRSTT